MTSLRIAFAGTPDFAVPALRALLASAHHVVGVMTQPDRPKGRGQQLASSPVKQLAQQHGLPISQPATLKTDTGRADLRAWHCDVLVVVAYGLILPQAVLDLPRLGCLNIHASLLPRWRGAAPIQRAILTGDTETGVTIMRMDAGLDTGPMLLQRSLPIGPSETSSSLHDRLADIGGAALLEALEGVAGGTLPGKPQPAEGITYATKIEKAEALIDWNQSAIHLDRQVRAFNPWPIAETRLEGEQLRIFAAHVAGTQSEAPDSRRVPAASPPYSGQAADHSAQAAGRSGQAAGTSAEPGTVIAVRNDAFVVACGQGQLAITVAQRPGRKPVEARDLANALALLGRRLG